jgi:hypothetical protein
MHGGQVQQLVPLTSYVGHSSTIFAICYDDVRDQVISSAKDGLVIPWSKDGKVSDITM